MRAGLRLVAVEPPMREAIGLDEPTANVVEHELAGLGLQGQPRPSAVLLWHRWERCTRVHNAPRQTCLKEVVHTGALPSNAGGYARGCHSQMTSARSSCVVERLVAQRMHVRGKHHLDTHRLELLHLHSRPKPLCVCLDLPAVDCRGL